MIREWIHVETIYNLGPGNLGRKEGKCGSAVFKAAESDAADWVLRSCLRRSLCPRQSGAQIGCIPSSIEWLGRVIYFEFPLCTQYDIVLDVLVVNQTADTLQNVTLELATLGDLRLGEKPQPLTMGPHDFTNIKANVKVRVWLMVDCDIVF